MEVIKRYQGLDEIIESMAKIANNLEEMTRIQKMYESNPLPDYDPEILRKEIQDLKLENDLLKKRDEIAQHFIKSVRCKGLVCENCDLHFLNAQGTDLCAQVDHVKLEAIASNVLKKLEEL